MPPAAVLAYLCDSKVSISTDQLPLSRPLVLRASAVSRSQFARVLQTISLYTTDREFDVLVKAYNVDVGGRTDVHYRSFCEDVERTAHQLNAQLTGGTL